MFPQDWLKDLVSGQQMSACFLSISLFLLFLIKKTSFFIGLISGTTFLAFINFFLISPTQLLSYPRYLLATETTPGSGGSA